MLYLAYCMPRMTLDNNTGKIEFSYEWISADAKQTYEQLGELVSAYFESERKQYLKQFISYYEEKGE